MTTETTQRVPLLEDDGDDEQPRDWFFTFGIEDPALEHRFVRINGTYMEARLKMIAAFSQRWCAQYDSAENAGVARYGLTELVLPDQQETVQ